MFILYYTLSTNDVNDGKVHLSEMQVELEKNTYFYVTYVRMCLKRYT